LEDAQQVNMKSFCSFLGEALDPKCSEQSKFVWKGAVKETALCNFKDGVVWQGAIQSVSLFNIKGGVMWEGALQAKAIGNFKGGILWAGMIQQTALCNMREGVVWQGAVQAKAVANYGIQIGQANECGSENLFLWQDMVRSIAIFNSATKLSNHTKMALVYWFLMRTKSVNKKTASGDKPKAVKTKPTPIKGQASKA